MNPVKKIAHLTKMCTLTGACLSGRLLYLRSHGEGRYVVPLKRLPCGEFQERWKEELAGREESKDMEPDAMCIFDSFCEFMTFDMQ
jgi:hypothetical protein